MTGKQIYTGQTWRERDDRLQRVIFQVVERTIAADGQRLLVPEIEIETWWTSPSARLRLSIHCGVLSMGSASSP